MAPSGTDPAASTPNPFDGDGSELIGNIVDGRYRLDATIGRGGMGLVYRATHVKLRRPAAVKILHPSLAASPDVRNRFDREVLAAGRIKHPNCVETYDSGSLPDGGLYLAMELLEGRALSAILEVERQLAPGRALHILAHVLRGLGHIHASGLIHRDVKPENIFLIQNGDDLDFAKILDFGIAKPMKGEIDDGVRLTQAGMAFGTPIYMAPEQALGNKLDGRADLYAAAIIAYEMLCGAPPFYSEDKLEVMSMHAGKAVPAMRTRLIKTGKPVPSSIERLVLKGLTKKPAERYADADVFLAAVEHALATPDGGVTDVNFERPEVTGSRSLLRDDGKVDVSSSGHEGSIARAIDEVLSGETDEPTAIAPKFANLPRAKTPRSAWVPRGTTMPGVGTTDEQPQRPSAQPTASSPATTAPAPPVVAAGEPRGRPPAGGVGLGIPYTGPSGEPIFGLTPEQRLAQVPKRRPRWPLYAGIVAAAVIVGIVVAIATKPSAHGDDDAIDPDSPAGVALDAYTRGEPQRALDLLAQQPAQALARDRGAQLVIGHARAALRDNASALAAYTAALDLDPRLGKDDTLRANLRVMAADRDPDVVMHAFDLWVGRTDDARAKPALHVAAGSDDLERRHAAWPIVERYHLDDADLRLNAFVLDLQQERSCEQRRAAVGSLRALGDVRAIPQLERALVRQPGRIQRNQCLFGDATAAIGALHSLEKKK